MDDEDEYVVQSDTAFEIYGEQNISNTYTVTLDTAIKAPSEYRNLFQLLRNATDKDIIKFHINSPGGMLGTGIPLYNAILGTQAFTIAVVEFEASSAATLPVIACDKVFMMPGSYLMVHNASYGVPRMKVKDVRSYVDFSDNMLNEWVKDTYEGFLTEQELIDVMENGKDLFIRADEVQERLDRRLALLEEEFDENSSEEVESC